MQLGTLFIFTCSRAASRTSKNNVCGLWPYKIGCPFSYMNCFCDRLFPPSRSVSATVTAL